MCVPGSFYGTRVVITVFSKVLEIYQNPKGTCAKRMLLRLLSDVIARNSFYTKVYSEVNFGSDRDSSATTQYKRFLEMT